MGRIVGGNREDDEDIFRSHCLACLPVDGTELELPRSEKPDRVTEVYRSRATDSTHWAWSNGILKLNVKQEVGDFLGLLVSS